MESSGGGGAGGGPAPFLVKTYEMIDDSSTDEIVSWSSNNTSFIVWNHPEFARLLLPTYFKHNNFSSFIRQLNTYGFRKIDPERWEFSNEEFIKDQKHLLKNIHRRKPIHSHTQPQGTSVDAERATLDEEIDRLSREKAAIQANLWRFKQEQPEVKLQLDDLEIRVHEMEERQTRMITFLSQAVGNPTFVECLIRMTGSSLEFPTVNKKRRLPKGGHIQDITDTSLTDIHSSTFKPHIAHVSQLEFSEKLNLGLSPAVSHNNLLSQSSNENGGIPLVITSNGEPKESNIMTDGFRFLPETLELSDTCTSLALKKDVPSLGQVRASDLDCTEEGDVHTSCHLNLTLSSSTLHGNDAYNANKLPQFGHKMLTSVEPRSNTNQKESHADDNATISSSKDSPINNQRSAAPPGRVNDVFWEQFLTERPGSSDTEEASSCFREVSSNEHEETQSEHGDEWRNRRDMEQLTL
ncbi:hypothetical protein GIB67_034976 [Kingdonia uniflora]|uniref:HSF-type DNA-binding domain-containing protein n=1 Tax=Kingdonia uniflora TaxID=39325 RepID=A0A7J7NGW8_9MAGN|nr:hypothetical protein GIB67_034976 [Kingdonia uniflora]